MFASLSLGSLIAIFILAAVVVWVAGISLTRATDVIDIRFGLGEALGGLIFLSFVTNLPEIAIVTSAALAKNLGIAIGNILGGIAIQTVVLAILDGFGLRSQAALTHKAGSLQLVLEGLLVISILVIAIMGSQLPQSVVFMNIAPGDVLIAVSWLGGLWLINKAQRRLPWRKKIYAHERGRPTHTRSQQRARKWGMKKVICIFTISSLLTLIAGVVLQETGTLIAAKIGWSGVLFGSTILALVTSLPEISTGLAAVNMGDYTLAISDIFGGNAFLPVLFLPATLISGQSVLPLATKTDIYLASLGVLLTAVYICGLLFRYKRQIFCLGIDSMMAVVIYIIGMIGLFLISST